MRILVTGAEGQLGTEFVKAGLEFARIKSNFEIYGFNKKSLDITNSEQIKECFENVKPDVVINCAAYTNVDGCESNEEAAYEINAKGVGLLAGECLKWDCAFVHISTDYVFDGTKGQEYFEFDTPNPLNVYGKSKLAGEEIVKTLLKKFYIVRTSWLYGQGKNFVHTMLELSKTKDNIEVVNDQIGCPTYASELAMAIIALLNTKEYGIYHITNSGYCSWYELACKIFEIKNIKTNVIPIDTMKLNRPAKRPGFSVLGNARMKYKLRNWDVALKEYLTKD
ncbi:MAG: dTDP-4-dehydrorhamnose reductase [Deltaproteobacteria bacterium]